MTEVKGKWALVTGANRGIGYRIAKFMAGKGCNLILHSRSLEHTAAVLAEVRAMGVEAYDVAAELSDLSQVKKMIERGFGRVINTTSGIRNEPEQAGYSASKAALDKVTSDLAGKLDGTDVCINLADPGWCRTDLGGPNAPNDPDSVIPGIVVGAFVDDKKSGRWLGAQDFAGLSLEEAIKKAADYPQLF